MEGMAQGFGNTSDDTGDDDQMKRRGTWNDEAQDKAHDDVLGVFDWR